jgi:hypothetical protein
MSGLPVQEAAQSKQNLHILILYSALESLLVTILTSLLGTGASKSEFSVFKR